MEPDNQVIQPTVAPMLEPEIVRLTPKHPLPNPKDMVELTRRGATLVSPLGTFDMKGLMIDHDRLADAMSDISADIGWFAGYEAAASHVLARLELQLKRKRAELSQQWQSKKALGQKLTVNDIEHNISLDVDVQMLEDQHADAKYNLELLAALRKAHETKARQLQSATGLRRTETDADIHRHRMQSIHAVRPDGEVVQPS